MAIHMIKIRATVTIGNLSVSTPFILSFNVNKVRGQISNFSASLKVKHDNVGGRIVGDLVRIKAGAGSASHDVFSGMVRSANITPCRDDPLFVILNISGVDVLSRLEGKKYTRRCRSTKGVWVSIENVTRPGLKSGKLAYVPAKDNLTTSAIDVNKKDTTTKSMVRGVPKNVPTARDGSPTEEVRLDIVPIKV